MPVYSHRGSIWQHRDIVEEMQYIEAVINMAFILEKENHRTLFLTNSETHACVGEPDTCDRIGQRSDKILNRLYEGI